ncbi:hypothetical protein ABK040_003573 [Willaertia magna]
MKKNQNPPKQTTATKEEKVGTTNTGSNNNNNNNNGVTNNNNNNNNNAAAVVTVASNNNNVNLKTPLPSQQKGSKMMNTISTGTAKRLFAQGISPITFNNNKHSPRRNIEIISPTTPSNYVGKTGELVNTFKNLIKQGEVICACYVKTNNTVWSGGPKGQLSIFDLRHGLTNLDYRKVELDISTTFCTSLTYIPGVDKVLSGFENGKIAIWDALTGEKERELLNLHSSAITRIILVMYGSNENKKYTIWTCSLDQTIRIIDYFTLQPLQVLNDHKAPIRCMYFLDKKHHVWTCSDDGIVKVRDAMTGRVIKELPSYSNTLHLVYSGNYIWASGNDGKLRVYDIDRLKCLKEIKSHDQPIASLIATSKQIWSCGEDKVIHIFDTTQVKAIKKIKGNTVFVKSMVELPESKIFAFCSDNKVRIWECEGEPVIPAMITMINNIEEEDDDSSDEEIELPINNVRWKEAFEKEIVNLRKQLQETTSRISKYKTKLKIRRLKIQEREIESRGISMKYNILNQTYEQLLQERKDLIIKLKDLYNILIKSNNRYSKDISVNNEELNFDNPLNGIKLIDGLLLKLDMNLQSNKIENIKIDTKYEETLRNMRIKMMELNNKITQSKGQMKILIDQLKQLKLQNEELSNQLEQRKDSNVEKILLEHVSITRLLENYFGNDISNQLLDPKISLEAKLSLMNNFRK